MKNSKQSLDAPDVYLKSIDRGSISFQGEEYTLNVVDIMDNMKGVMIERKNYMGKSWKNFFSQKPYGYVVSKYAVHIHEINSMYPIEIKQLMLDSFLFYLEYKEEWSSEFSTTEI